MGRQLSALITAGGRGSRLASLGQEKPLVQVLGERMVDRAISTALAVKGVRTVYVSTSHWAPRTEDHVRKGPAKVVRTAGKGYVEDLHDIMSVIEEDDVLIMPSDMPLVRSASLDEVIAEYYRLGMPSLTVTIDPQVLRDKGLAVTHTEVMDGREVTFCGVSVLDRKEMLKDDYIAGSYIFMSGEEFAINVNTPSDLDIAEAALKRRER
ncbi:MAG: Adenosylcobinamide-phosphate guanylyltransferase [Methanomassiliicoccales archaeon PtaU1.Bin124]|nr:MAG: Adenosylcobinamide-phosphate guanylyltransferase [Methanomassiliicoccales archaeon PtaU1.Bin124]